MCCFEQQKHLGKKKLKHFSTVQGSEYTRSLVDKKKEGSVVSTSSLLMNMSNIIFILILYRFKKIDFIHQGSKWAETENPEAGAAV